MSTVPRSRMVGRRLLLRGVSWAEYRRLLRAFESRRGVRLTFDRGILEIMSPRPDHEMPSQAFSHFVLTLAEELQLPLRAGGSMTLKRRRKQRGLEPDRCWWIANAARLQGRLSIDLASDPPPDLAVEVDVTSSSLDRMSLYAALGVPEVWRLDRQGLTFHVLDGRAYREQASSLSFPVLTSADLGRFLARLGQVDDITLNQEFRAWLRLRIASGGSPSPGQVPS